MFEYCSTGCSRFHFMLYTNSSSIQIVGLGVLQELQFPAYIYWKATTGVHYLAQYGHFFTAETTFGSGEDKL